MLIKIISGIYGRHIGKSVEAMRPGDPPFEVDDNEGLRLVALKIAAVVEPDAEDIDGEEIPEYSMKNNLAQLRAIANQFGVQLSEEMTKAKIVSTLDRFFEGTEEDDDLEVEPNESSDPPAMAPDEPVL